MLNGQDLRKAWRASNSSDMIETFMMSQSGREMVGGIINYQKLDKRRR